MGNQVTESSSFSLEKRIRYRLVLAMLPLLLVLMFIIHKSIHLLIDEIVVERLQHDALSLISAVTEVDDSWKVGVEALPAVYQRVRSGHYFILQWNGGEIRSRSLWDKKVDPSDFVQGDTEDYLYFWIDEEFWVVHQQPFVKKGEVFNLWVAEDISEIDQKQKVYEYFLAAILVLFTFIFIFWQRSVLNKGFALLEPIQRALKENQTSGQPEFPEKIPQEIKALVDSINLLVDRSAQQVARSRMSVGNLAHELKRPLQELQIIASELKDPESQQTLKQVIRKLQERIDAELKRARISGNPMPGNLFKIDEEIPVLQGLLNRIYAKDIAFKLNSNIELLPFDRDDTLELLGNLLDNAWKYASSTVHLNISGEGQGFAIRIEDDGPGVAAECFAEINQRGTRIDEHSTRPGDGLGLSICQAIVESYNGKISFSRSELGGLRVDVAIQNNIVN
jgi:signal transduction histidine kinase